MDTVMPYVLALVPTIGVATLFYFVIKSILEGDRRERLAQAQWEAEHRKAGQGNTDQRNDGPHGAAEPPADDTSIAPSPMRHSGDARPHSSSTQP